MSTVTVVLVKESRKDGKFPVKIRVGKVRKYAFECLFYIKPTHWNDSAKQVHSYERDSSAMNKLIRRRLKEVQELVDQYEGRGWPFSPQDILAINYDKWKNNELKVSLELDARTGSIPTGMLAYMKTIYIPYWKRKQNLNNAEKYEIEMDLLSDFLKTKKQADIPMAKVNTEFVQEYFNYLRTKSKNPCRKDSTLKRKHAQIMAVLRYAHGKGNIEFLPELDVDFDLQKAKKPKLDPLQLETLINYKWDFNHITRKDVLKGHMHVRLSVQTFLLQFYLYGARIGDAMSIRNKNVITRKGKPVRIEFYQQKGRKNEGKRLMSINIHHNLMPIILEYWNGDKPEQFLLPWLQDRYEFDFTKSEAENDYNLKYAIHQATSLNNQALKRACQMMDLDLDKLTSHSARHTFAQRAKRKGISIEFIKESLGHSNYDITANYLADLDMEELNKNLSEVY